MDKKPNQVVDINLGRVFPPPEAIVPQLASVRAMATSAINVYEATEDVHSVQPNLDTIQRIIDYLRGAPIQENTKPAPEDTLKPEFTFSSDVNFSIDFNKNGEYEVEVYGVDIEPSLKNEDLFGRLEDLEQPALEITLKIPVICNTNYEVTQVNPALEMYKDDLNIFYDEEWTKSKVYNMTKDYFEYSFLITEGRNKIKIFINHEENENFVPLTIFNINSHIHFKEDGNV